MDLPRFRHWKDRLLQFFFSLSLLTVLGAPLSFAQSQDFRPEKPRAKFQVEWGIDSLERRSYQPEFLFQFPLLGNNVGRFFVEFKYLERLNSRLQGAVDYWLNAGFERNLSGQWKVEARLNHICRHLTLKTNPDILSLNEVLARAWFDDKSFQIGFGIGGYLDKDKAYKNLLVFSLNLTPRLFPAISLESEFKWVNRSRMFHEVGFSLALNKSTALFLRNAKQYEFPSTTYMGLRFKAEGENEKYLDNFGLMTDVYPFYDHHKLVLRGDYRLKFLERSRRRFYLDVGFQTPILSGDNFFAQFWPDNMLYGLKGTYEYRVLNSLYIAWYAAYALDMPVDDNLPFQSGLATGIEFRNQSDFERLQRVLRYEISAGLNFRMIHDFTFKFGMNTLRKNSPNIGWEIRFQDTKPKWSITGDVFVDFGRMITIRPFFGFRNIQSSGRELPEEGTKLRAGIGLYKWF